MTTKHKYLVKAWVKPMYSFKPATDEWFTVYAENEEQARNEVRIECAKDKKDVNTFEVVLKADDEAPGNADR